MKKSEEVDDPSMKLTEEQIALRRILVLCKKYEWGQVDSLLRQIDKGAPEINYAEKINESMKASAASATHLPVATKRSAAAVKVSPVRSKMAEIYNLLEESGDFVTANGITPLMVAAKENKIVVVDRLADLGAGINELDSEGKSALHYAAAFAKDDVVKTLINKKADCMIAGGPYQQLPLHMSCSRAIGALGIVQQILKASAKEARSTPDKDGRIPLFLAAECGSTAICKELLLQESDIQVTTRRQSTGDTILHIACRKRDVELAKVVCEAGVLVDAQNNKGHSALHVSAEEGDEAMIKYLLTQKVDPNITDKHDRSPLHMAAERGHTNLVDLLVEKAKADHLGRTKDGSTLMHVASEFGYPDTAVALLKKGVPMMMPNKSGAICLHTASKKGHVAVVRALLQKGAAVDALTKDRYTSLHIAVEACKPLVIQTLLGYGASVELKGGKAKETPLHIAARIPGAELCVEMLIKCGADVDNTKQNGETALHIAARHGHLKVVQAVLAEGSDPTMPSEAGETPIHMATRYCHWEVADELLKFVSTNKSKIDATILVNQQNAEGETSVHYAAELLKSQAHHEFEDTDVIKLLLDYGGDTNIATRLTQETPMHYCARAGNSDILLEMVKVIEPIKVQVAVNKQAKNGWSPLLSASKEGHIEIVKILLQNHARVDVFDEHGKAALHHAAENGHLDVSNILLCHKAFVNAKSKIGLTPLHLAAQNGYNSLVELLIGDHGASVDALSLAKKTPLHMAAETGQMAVCGTLITMKAGTNATDEQGQTPLHLAAENDHSDVIKLFLKHNPDLVTMANTNGMTYAHIAASKGSVGVIKELMRFNRTVICTAKNRTSESTSLHLAAEGGHKDVVEALLAAGADPLCENTDGMTPIHLAAKHGHDTILDVLRDHIELNTTSSKSGFTALHVAAHFGQTNTVRELLTKVVATIKSENVQDGKGAFQGENQLSSETDDLQQYEAALGYSGKFGLTPLHLAAQSGHEGLVRVLLNSPGVQADAQTATQGSIPLHLAAQNGHTAVVSLLLSKSTSLIHIKDKRGRTGLHLAAAGGQLDMVALLLGQGADINSTDKNGWAAIHYCAKAGHLNVVKLLCDGGASTIIETKDGKAAICYAAAAAHTDVLSYLTRKAYDTQQLMDDKKFVFDLMVCGKTNQQKSIEEFITLSPAPCETSAKMSKNFADVAAKEKERAKDLILASQFCEVMATELMAIAAHASSPNILLKSVDVRGTPFLDILIECGQKEVVAHPTIQKYLSDVWMGGIQWKTWKIILLFIAFVFIPPVWIVFSLPLKHKYNRVPIFKFMSYLVSHFFFIVLLILVVAIPLYSIPKSHNLFPNPVEWLLLAWLSGLLVAELTNPGDRTGLGWIRVIILSLSAVGVVLHIAGLGFEGNDRFTILFIRNQFFAFALLLCFVQFLDFLSFHHLFGPWAIIISSLVLDLVKFLVILLAFMCGFTLHVSAIYQPVYPEKPLNATLGDGNGNAGAVYLNPLDVFELLFFSLFGLVEPENLPPTSSSPAWAREMIKCVFGVYMLVTLIVLINLLIAMMSDTYQRIQAQSDTEWKFGRAKLIRNMNKTSSTPSPINLLAKLFTYIKVLIKYRGRVCTAEGQDLINEEEGLGDDDDMEATHGVSQGWLRNNASIAPEGGAPRKKREPLKMERAIDWLHVIHKFHSMKGDSVQEDNSTSSADTDSNNNMS